MRLILLLLWLGILVQQTRAQHYFPIKVDKKWGLIDADGQVRLPPVYDAIGEFKQYGYAVMQRQGRVGLLDRMGRELVSPRYEDISVLDSAFIAVKDRERWMVIDLDGKVLLPPGYEHVQVWERRFLAYVKEGKWGLLDRDGRPLAAPVYDEISCEGGRFFITRQERRLGLLDEAGWTILPNEVSEINILSDSLIFFRKDNHWGAVDRLGHTLIDAAYDAFSRLSDQFVKLSKGSQFALFSMACRRLTPLGAYENFYAFSARHVMVKKDRLLGLLDCCGEETLSTRYQEIQYYDETYFRAFHRGKWGIVASGDREIAPFRYDYLSPLRGKVCVVKDKMLFGLVNFAGELIVEPAFTRIEVENGRAHAYKPGAGGGESLTIFYFDEQGRLKDNDTYQKHYQIKIGASSLASSKPIDHNTYLLDKFEWFYAPDSDRWGLRRLADGAIQIKPIFQYVQPEKDLGFTLVGVEKPERFDFQRTTYRFASTYGLVSNDSGVLLGELEFWDIRFSDFREGHPAARCVFSNGRHGLIDRAGRVLRRDLTYLGAFQQGVARVALQGKLSGSLKANPNLGRLGAYLKELRSPAQLVDFTQYDQLFSAEAFLVCEQCEWGYLDAGGKMIAASGYTFAHDFINGVGIVARGDKWGMVNRKGELLIPCRYDGVQFLENTGNTIVRVYIREPKYGLIDTLGQLAINTLYDELGSFSEGRLAVKRNGLWGFVDRDGLEIIPCRFREVQNFSEGLAAVKLGRAWGFIDKQGNIEIDFQYLRAGNFRDGLAWVSDGKSVCFVDRAGKPLSTPKLSRAFDFQHGVARVIVNDKYGLIDRRGRLVARPRFTAIGEFDAHGLAVVSYGKQRQRQRLINLRGELITSLPFREIGEFSEGLAAVKYRDAYGFIDTSGRLVIPCVFSKVSRFSEGRAAAQKDGACGYIDRQGQAVVPFAFTKCLDFEGGKAVVYKGIRRAGLVDPEGRTVIEPSINRLIRFQEGRGLVRDDNYRFYYITEQASLYSGFYQDATAFRHGVAVVQVNDKWGIINQRGLELIPPKYDQIDSFENGFAKVRITGFTGLSNLDGELIAQPAYEYISYAGEGLFRVEQGDKIGYFDMNGNWVWDLTK
jgi:hypothetical protein